MSLPMRKLGQASVSAIGYGCMGIAAFYGKPLPDEERLKVRYMQPFSQPLLTRPRNTLGP